MYLGILAMYRGCNSTTPYNSTDHCVIYLGKCTCWCQSRVYALVHEFFALVIEGDEAYTKVQKNVPPDQSSGWTILLMDRASRFIWELDCGKKDRRLFKKAIKTLARIARQTHDLSLFTDGERRYG